MITIWQEVLRRTRRASTPEAAVSNGYGMTEAGPAYAILPKEEATRREGSVGKAIPPTEFLVVDAQSRLLPAGEIGELVITTPGGHREYYRDPEATAELWEDGWLRTGDLGRVDGEGYLYIVGRE